MSALTVASVTAVLKSLLENGLVSKGVSASVGGDAAVSVLPPDRIATGPDERPQLNLFLYLVRPSTGLRGATGALGLELHYLLTAYGSADYQTEILLGFALELFHHTPALEREALGRALRAASGADDGRVVSPSLAALAASDLPQSVEQIRIAPQFLGAEEASRLWSSLQAKYRPSAAYKVSVVPIGAGP